MILKGATVNFLGDSITEGAGASCLEKCYVSVLEKEFGLKKANNYGIGGTRIARQPVVTDSPFDQDYCMRMSAMDESADAVVVFGGTNDFGHGLAPLGVPSDRTPETFWGACHYLMDGLMSRYVGKPVMIVTPLHRLGEENPKGDSGKPASVAPLRVYRDILIAVAQYYALPVLDLYSVSGMQPANPACRERLMPDGLHPSDEGHAILARKIGLFLETL